jgi:hypothetical protein
MELNLALMIVGGILLSVCGVIEGLNASIEQRPGGFG